MEVKGTNLDKKVININPCSIETIDRALMKWVKEDMDLYCTTNKGWTKVPVRWSTAERARQTKEAREARDSAGHIILPALTVERTAVVKDGFLYAQAGAGIVADSKPINEYIETENKAKALIKAME